MKKIVSICVGCLMASLSMAQTAEYQTFIYTSDDLADDIQQCEHDFSLKNGRKRGMIGELGLASLNAAKGIASGYVTSFIDMGVNAVASLITRNSRLKEEWEKTVTAENTWQSQISTVSDVNDFYKDISFAGAMDPKGMRFDGIGCLRKEGNDTLFYISCHIDRSKLQRIINHSKFELVLDTLIISPTHSNLPNTRLNIPFSFTERRNFNLGMNIKLTSSWITADALMQKEQELGEFAINIPVDESVLDEKGFLHYVRKKGEPSAYAIVGESFIVPRSYMGYRENDEYNDIWGTGQYKISVQLMETCDITDAYRADWKNDHKRRKNMQPKDNFFATSWKMVSNQKWDAITQSWVITTLKAPAGIITKDVIDKLGLEQAQQQKQQQPQMPK